MIEEEWIRFALIIKIDILKNETDGFLCLPDVITEKKMFLDICIMPDHILFYKSDVENCRGKIGKG